MPPKTKLPNSSFSLLGDVKSSTVEAKTPFFHVGRLKRSVHDGSSELSKSGLRPLLTHENMDRTNANMVNGICVL